MRQGLFQNIKIVIRLICIVKVDEIKVEVDVELYYYDMICGIMKLRRYVILRYTCTDTLIGDYWIQVRSIITINR